MEDVYGRRRHHHHHQSLNHLHHHYHDYHHYGQQCYYHDVFSCIKAKDAGGQPNPAGEKKTSTMVFPDNGL